MNCDICGLNKERQLNIPIPISNNGIMFVLDSPSMIDVEKQTPYLNVNGIIIKEILKELNYKEDNCCFTYACLCANNINRSPSSVEITACSSQLHTLVEQYKPRIIVTLGLLALRSFFPEVKDIEELRGLPLYWNEYLVFPTYSPGYVLHYIDKMTLLQHDIESACFHNPKIMEKPLPILFGLSEKYEAIGTLQLLAINSNIASIDIETTGLNRYNDYIRLIGISVDNKTSFQFNTLLIYDKEFIAALDTFLENRELIGHNGIAFDSSFLKEQLGIDVEITDDTMIKHYILDERKGSHSLGFVARNYLFTPEYKSAVKDYVNVPIETLSEYLAWDTCSTFALNSELQSRMTPIQLDLYYAHLYPLACSLAKMNVEGVLIDKPYLSNLSLFLEKRYERIVKALKHVTENNLFNPNSPQQVATLIYNKMKLPLHPKLGRTTGEEWLNTIAPDNKIIKFILAARSTKKLKSTYCDGILNRLDKDGKIRTSYLIHGTGPGRLSSTNPNLQNLPVRMGPIIKKAFIAPPGYVFVEGDYSQLELRMAAWYSNEQNLIDAFNNDEDIHTKTASFIFKKNMGDVTSDERFAAKSINFGILYGMGADKLSKAIKRPIVEAIKYLSEWHLMYPEYTQWDKKIRKEVNEKGYVENPLGRRRRFPLITNFNRDEVEREAVNALIQGFSFDVCATGLIRLNEDDWGGKPILNVHDSNICLIPDDEQLLERISYMKIVMEDSMAYMGFDSPVKFKVDMKWGYNWGEMNKCNL